MRSIMHLFTLNANIHREETFEMETVSSYDGILLSLVNNSRTAALDAKLLVFTHLLKK